jgi:hypothetical protein
VALLSRGLRSHSSQERKLGKIATPHVYQGPKPSKEPNRQLFTRHIRGGLLLAISLRHLDTAQLPVTMLPLVELQAATTGRSTLVLDEGALCTSPPTMAKVSIARTAIIIVTNPNRRK